MSEQWTPDRLQTPAGRRVHLEQHRQALQPIIDNLRRVAREVEAEAREAGPIDGDFPGQHRLRARNVARPLHKAADDVEQAITDLVAFNRRFQRSFEELPQRRREKAERKARAKGTEPPAIESSQVSGSRDADSGPSGEYGNVFNDLRKGA